MREGYGEREKGRGNVQGRESLKVNERKAERKKEIGRDRKRGEEEES